MNTVNTSVSYKTWTDQTIQNLLGTNQLPPGTHKESGKITQESNRTNQCTCVRSRTVDSRFKDSRREMENSSLYREFVISKNLKILFFSQILNSKLDLYLKCNESGEDDENLRFE